MLTLNRSGPAGGVRGVSHLVAQNTPYKNLITLDMGGTSTDCALLSNGETVLRRETNVGPLTVKAPSVDVRTVGAGESTARGEVVRIAYRGVLTVTKGSWMFSNSFEAFCDPAAKPTDVRYLTSIIRHAIDLRLTAEQEVVQLLFTTTSRSSCV